MSDTHDSDSAAPAAVPPEPGPPHEVPSSSELEKAELNTGLYRILLFSNVGTYALLGLGAALTWSSLIGTVAGFNFNWGGLVALVPTGHLFGFALRSVDKDERAAMYWFGEYIRPMKPGLHFVPAAPLTEIVRMPHDTQTILEPGPRDEIFLGEEDKPLPEGMVRPLFMQTRGPETGENKPLDAQLQVGVSFEVIWVVEDVATFLQNMKNIREAEPQIRSLAVTSLAEVLIQGTGQYAIDHQPEVNAKFLDRLQEKTKNFGIKVNRANLTSINLSHALATSLRDRAKAELDKETTIIKTDAEAYEIERLGAARGKAAAAEAKGPLEGRGDGMAHIAEQLKVPGSRVLASETAVEALSAGNALILGGPGLEQIPTLGALLDMGRKTTTEPRKRTRKRKPRTTEAKEPA
jgi:regulator of protease activity HflC (stomatin/prohibitin superfamily)